MDWSQLWKSVLLILSAMVLLRLAGRKSISQMTVPTTVIMISIGTVIVQPIANKSVWMAIIAAAIFVAILISVEALQLRWNWFERMLRGPAVVVIRDGQLLPDELKNIRLTVDQLEMKLRQAGLPSIQDIKTATIETNGQIGYELMEDAKPITMKQMKELLNIYFPNMEQTTEANRPNLFTEVTSKEAHIQQKRLQ